MFSPAIRKPHLQHRKDKETRDGWAEGSRSPSLIGTADGNNEGLLVPGRPITGTPAPWTSSSSSSRLSVLARISMSKKAEKVDGSDPTQPVYVSAFPQVVRNAQTNLQQKIFSGKSMIEGSLDKETSLAWMICGDELFIWSYLAQVAKDCVVLQVPSSVVGNKDMKPLYGNDWIVCMISWNNPTTRNGGDMLQQNSSVGVILVNRRVQAIAYWPDIYTKNSKDPVISRIDWLGDGKTSANDNLSECYKFNSVIAAAVPGSFHECIMIACEPTGVLWLFECAPAEIFRRKVHEDPLGDNLIGHSQKNNGARSLIWLPRNALSGASDRKFFLLTNHEVQCWSIVLSPSIDVTKLGSHEIVGSDGDLGIKKDIAGQKNIWLLDMQIDECGREFNILVATFCKDRVSGSNYTQYSLLTMHYKPNKIVSSEQSMVKSESFLEKKAPSQVIIPKARVEEEDFLFSMRLRIGGKPSGSVIILSGDGTATVAIYWRGSTRLYQFDLPWDAGKVLDASILLSPEDREEGAWVVLTEKAGVWAIPEKAVLVGGVEPPERSLSRKGSCNEAVAEEKRSQTFSATVVPRRASSEAWSAGERQRPALTTIAQQQASDEEAEMLLSRLFHGFVLCGAVQDALQKLRVEGAFEKEGEMNVFVRMSKSIVNTLAKHWTTTREADFLASTIVSSLLLEKQHKHQKFLQFLTVSECREELSSKQRAAMLTVMEHGEKLSGMIQLRELQNTLIQQHLTMTSLTPQSKTQTAGYLWSLIQLVGEKARRDTVLLMDRDNAEVFYSKISDIEDLFYCLSHHLGDIITGEEHPSVQVQCALELSNACMTLIQSALKYRDAHKHWYPSPEGLIPWNSQPVVRSGIWDLASFIMELLKVPGSADMTIKSDLWSQLEGLTDVLLDAYISLITAKVERGEGHTMLVQEYCKRRDELLGSLYEFSKQIMEAKYQESNRGTDKLELKESIFREVTSPVLATAKRHEGYQTLWHICYDLCDTSLLLDLMHDSVGPHGGFSFFVFKQLINSCQYSKLLRLGEEFQEELANFLKEQKDLLWLHEIFLRQFSCASETLHACALFLSSEEDSDLVRIKKSPSLAERRRLLYLSKIAATAGKDMNFEVNVSRIEADIQILKLQEAIVRHDPEYAQVHDANKLLRPTELIEMCLKRGPELSVKAFEVFAWTSSSFRRSNRSLLENCWRNAADQDDWVAISQVSTSEGWSDEVMLEFLKGTALFKVSKRCYDPEAHVYDGTFEEIMPLQKEHVYMRGLEDKCFSVEEVLMQHKAFPDAGKLMLTAVMMGKELTTASVAQHVDMDS